MEYRDTACIGVVSPAEIGAAWRELVKERSKDLTHAIAVDYDFAEETIAMLCFADGSYEVGIGESLRPYPYQCLYEGSDCAKATEVFLEVVREHTWYETEEANGI